jgi:hypothetical protein
MLHDVVLYKVTVTRTTEETVTAIVRGRPNATWEDIQQYTRRGDWSEEEVERVRTDMALEDYQKVAKFQEDTAPYRSDIDRD